MELYDFSDWESGEPPDLSKWLQENLREAFALFGKGDWYINVPLDGEDREDPSGTVLEWGSLEYGGEDPVVISFTPESLYSCLADHFGMDYAASPYADRQWVHRERLKADSTKVIAAWRSALDKVQAEVDRLLELPDANDGT